jgi:hypothetical protein
MRLGEVVHRFCRSHWSQRHCALLSLWGQDLIVLAFQGSWLDLAGVVGYR